MFKNQMKRVFDEIIYIYNSYTEFDKIDSVLYPTILEYSIGKKVPRMSTNSYENEFVKIIDSESYSIWMTDGSLICFEYVFDVDGCMVEHRLNFIPYLDSEELFRKTEDRVNSNYLRIDYGVEGQQLYNHSLIHLHMSLNPDGVRFPVSHTIYPIEFLYLILLYFYKIDIDKLRFRIDCEPRVSMIDDKEESMFKFRIK